MGLAHVPGRPIVKTDCGHKRDKNERRTDMGLIEASDISGLMQNPELMADIAKAVTESPGVMDAMADNVAGELEEDIQNYPELKKQIIDAVMANPQFKNRLVSKIVEELEDD